MTPYQSKDPSPTLLTNREKAEKEKIVEDKKGECNKAKKKALDLLLKPANPTPSNTGSTRSFQRDTEKYTDVRSKHRVQPGLAHKAQLECHKVGASGYT